MDGNRSCVIASLVEAWQSPGYEDTYCGWGLLRCASHRLAMTEENGTSAEVDCFVAMLLAMTRKMVRNDVGNANGE